MLPRAVLLLAGRGRRMGELTEERPKCMLDVGGMSVLERSLRSLATFGCREVVLVVGYKPGEILQLASDSFQGMRVSYVINERYGETNTAYSLWLAREHFDSPLLLIEGDIVFDEGLLAAVTREAGDESAWAAVPVGPGRDEGILLGTDAAGRVDLVELVKSPQERTPSHRHKCAGIQSLSADLASTMALHLDRTVSQGKLRVFADLVLGGLVSDYPVRLCSVEGHRWAEIDDLQDLIAAEQVFGPDISMREETA